MSKFDELHGVIGDYLDGLYDGDVEKLDRVFHPRAIYATADEAEPLYRNMGEYFPVVAERLSPAERDESRNGDIDDIQFAGENTAFARVRTAMLGRDFVDFLSFVREDDRWLIIAKVFHFAEREIQP
ncbi:MAG: nuclear transport factor 2 family protein [Pseudomonadota bacterium]